MGKGELIRVDFGTGKKITGTTEDYNVVDELIDQIERAKINIRDLTREQLLEVVVTSSIKLHELQELTDQRFSKLLSKFPDYDLEGELMSTLMTINDCMSLLDQVDQQEVNRRIKEAQGTEPEAS